MSLVVPMVMPPHLSLAESCNNVFTTSCYRPLHRVVSHSRTSQWVRGQVTDNSTVTAPVEKNKIWRFSDPSDFVDFKSMRVPPVWLDTVMPDFILREGARQWGSRGAREGARQWGSRGAREGVWQWGSRGAREGVWQWGSRGAREGVWQWGSRGAREGV
jgi:hypothetical protein